MYVMQQVLVYCLEVDSIECPRTTLKLLWKNYLILAIYIYIYRLIMMRCIFASINFSGLFLAFVQPNASLLGERQWQQQFDVVGTNFFQAKTICVAQKWNLYVDASLHTALLFKNALQSEQKLKHYLCIYLHSLEDPNT